MKNKTSKIILLVVLLVFNVFVWKEVLFSNRGTGILTVRFLNVGQGDATLIDDSYGNQILIDGGDGKNILQEIDKYLPFYDRNIELVILTHPDFDHLGGVLKVFKSYRVEHFLYSGTKIQGDAFLELQKILNEEKPEIILAKQGQRIVFGNNSKLDILYPDEEIVGLEVEIANEYSVVAKLISGNFSLLLPGDAGRQLEAHLLRSGIDLSADVLKVGHHGSKYSTHPLFFLRTNPEIAVISVGQNRYGHPTQEVLDRLKNILTLRTDMNGDITIRTDGKKMHITTEKN
jgi:competence protein ComEC